MKILLIGFIALACMGTTTINGKLYLSSAKEMAPAPLEKQRRIGNIDLYYKNAKKEQPVKKLRTVLNKEHIADFDSLMVSRFFIRSRNNPLLIQEKHAVANISKPTEQPSGKGELIDQLGRFFDQYGITGGIFALILLFAGIRYSMQYP